MSQPVLRACPTCGHEATKKELGLRDYRILTSKLGSKVGAMDYDFVLDQNRTHRKLIIEFKKPGQSLAMGQRIALRGEVNDGRDVWVVWENGDETVNATAMNKAGQTPFIEKAISEARLAELIAEWWSLGYAD